MTLLNPPSFLQNRNDHTAQQDRLMLGGLVSASGVGKPGDLAVTAQAAPNMSVRVAAGRCFIIGTQNTHQGVYHCYNDGSVNVTIAAASATLPRKDIIVAQVRDQFYSGANNDWQIIAVTGVPASSPAEPALPANSLKLATIDVAANASTITNANIVTNVLPATSALAPDPETQQQLAFLEAESAVLDPPFLELKRIADQALNNGQHVPIIWDDATYGEGIGYTLNSSVVNITMSGIYDVALWAFWNANTAGGRSIGFRSIGAGASFLMYEAGDSPDIQAALSIAAPIPLAAGSYEFTALQTAGVNALSGTPAAIARLCYRRSMPPAL